MTIVNKIKINNLSLWKKKLETMNKKIFTLAIIVAITISSTYTQIPPVGSGGLPPDGIPIDGGVGLLLAGLVGYAYKKFKNR